MNLKRIDNASVIHIKQYREWRNTGIAFEFGDQTYTEPNRTMAAYTEAKKKQHGSVLCRGLWTDIIISPYISFGVDCDTHGNRFAEQLFEIHNKGTGVEQNRHVCRRLCSCMIYLIHSLSRIQQKWRFITFYRISMRLKQAKHIV